MKQCHSEMPSYEEIIGALLKGGVEEMQRSCTLRPGEWQHWVPARCSHARCGPDSGLLAPPATAGVPVSPMLAKPTHGVSEVLDRFTNTRFVCEWKYDGERGQVRVCRLSFVDAAAAAVVVVVVVVVKCVCVCCVCVCVCVCVCTCVHVCAVV